MLLSERGRNLPGIKSEREEAVHGGFAGSEVGEKTEGTPRARYGRRTLILHPKYDFYSCFILSSLV